MTSITIPATVDAIDTGFFRMFSNAAAINAAAENQHFQTYNGMLFNSDLSSLLLVPEGMEGVAVLPEHLASVPACVFSRCTKLLAITLTGGTGNDSLSCQDGLLYTADGAVLVAAPAGIGASANIAATCTRIASGAFAGATDLRTIVTTGSVLQIDADAFEEGVPAAATVVLPADAPRDVWTSAGFTHFSQPAQAGDASEPETGSGFAFTLLDDGTVSVGWAGEGAPPADVRVPDYGRVAGVDYRVSRIADGGFAGLASFKTIELPATLTHIGAGAFEGCAGLQGATLPGGLVCIGDRAFARTALMSAVLPRSLEQVGADAFAGLHGTTIVATGVVEDVDGAALGNSRGVSVYVPASEAPCAWDAGLPSSGNSVRAYGLRFSSDAAQLVAGQTASLFGEDGYLLAPGDVQVTYAYRADCISVDTETGMLTAERTGPFKVDVTLSIPVNEAVSGGLSQRMVELSPASFGNEDGAARVVAPVQRVQRHLSDAYSFTGYVDAGADGQQTAIISVTVPMRVTFGGSAGYDINNGQPDRLVADAYFCNNGAPVLISRIETAVDAECRLSDVVTSVDEATDPLAGQPLFTLVGAGADIPLRYNDTFNDATGTRSIAAGQHLDCSYVLDLSHADLLMDADTADGSFIPLAQVRYTFTAVQNGAQALAAAQAAGDDASADEGGGVKVPDD